MMIFGNNPVKFHNDCINNNSSSVQCFVCMFDSFHDNVHTHSSLDETDPDSNFFNFVYPTLCNYYSNRFLTNMSQDQWNKSLSFYHANARSLVPNFESLNLSLKAIFKDFTVIGITETQFTKNSTNSTMCNLIQVNYDNSSFLSNNLSINETSYFQQALHNKAKSK